MIVRGLERRKESKASVMVLHVDSSHYKAYTRNGIRFKKLTLLKSTALRGTLFASITKINNRFCVRSSGIWNHSAPHLQWVMASTALATKFIGADTTKPAKGTRSWRSGG